MSQAFILHFIFLKTIHGVQVIKKKKKQMAGQICPVAKAGQPLLYPLVGLKEI